LLIFTGFSKENGEPVMEKKSRRAKARKMAYERNNDSVVTWITINSDDEEIYENDPNSSKGTFFFEEFDVSSSSEKSSPEISNVSKKCDPGTSRQDSKGPAVEMV
jgi:hypothetical protein